MSTADKLSSKIKISGFYLYLFKSPIMAYLNPTDACQTNASKRKNTGIAGITSTIGRNAVYGSGKADSKKLISIDN